MRHSPKFELSVARMPLVVTTVHDDLDEEDIEAMFAAWRLVFARAERFVSLCDVRKAKSMPSPKQRARTAELARGIEADSIRYSLGSAMVMSSSIVRGAMTAIDWLTAPKTPQAYVATMVEGYDWCVGKLRSADLRIPESVHTYRTELLAEQIAGTAATRTRSSTPV